MEGVIAHTKATEFTVDVRATRLGVLVRLQHHHASTIAKHKTVAIAIPRSASRLRVVVASRESTRCCETTQAQRRGGHLSTTRHHHISVAILDHAHCMPDVVRTRSTGSGNSDIWTAEAVFDRQVTGNHIDNTARHKEWRDTART